MCLQLLSQNIYIVVHTRDIHWRDRRNDHRWVVSCSTGFFLSLVESESSFMYVLLSGLSCASCIFACVLARVMRLTTLQPVNSTSSSSVSECVCLRMLHIYFNGITRISHDCCHMPRTCCFTHDDAMLCSAHTLHAYELAVLSGSVACIVPVLCWHA